MKLTNDLIKAHGPDLYRFCLSITGSKDLADDLYQDTFLKALTYSKPLREASVKSLFFKLAQRGWMDKKRKWARRNRLAPKVSFDQVLDLIVDSSSNVEDEAIDRDLRRALNKEILALPEEQKTVLLLFYQGDLKIKDIAKLLDIPQGTVKSRLFTAKETIGRGLKNYEE